MVPKLLSFQAEPFYKTSTNSASLLVVRVLCGFVAVVLKRQPAAQGRFQFVRGVDITVRILIIGSKPPSKLTIILRFVRVWRCPAQLRKGFGTGVEHESLNKSAKLSVLRHPARTCMPQVEDPMYSSQVS